MSSCVGDGQGGDNSTACCHRVLSLDSACILISVRCLLCGIERIGVGMGFIPISTPQRPFVSHSLLIRLLSFPILCFSHNHTHPFITGSTPIPSPTHSITHTHSVDHIPAKTERSPQTRFRTGANSSIDSRSSSSRSFSIHTLDFDLSFSHSLFHSIPSLIPFSSSPKR